MRFGCGDLGSPQESGRHSQPRVTNFLTFDIEEWFRANYEGLAPAAADLRDLHLEALAERLVSLCAEADVHCTCFVLGAVAERYPGVVRLLHAAGHEIASHGFHHLPVSSMTPEEFREDLRRSCDLLSSLTGEAVLGFRAPSFSVTKNSLAWFYRVLEEEGLTYSSSVFPGKTFLYGIPDFPNTVHRPGLDVSGSAVLEFPISRIAAMGMTIPLYLRLFPAWTLKWRIVYENRRGLPVVLYAHPREIDPDQPRLPLKWAEGLVHYWGVGGCERKLGNLIRHMGARFGRLRDAVGDYRQG